MGVSSIIDTWANQKAQALLQNVHPNVRADAQLRRFITYAGWHPLRCHVIATSDGEAIQELPTWLVRHIVGSWSVGGALLGVEHTIDQSPVRSTWNDSEWDTHPPGADSPQYILYRSPPALGEYVRLAVQIMQLAQVPPPEDLGTPVYTGGGTVPTVYGYCITAKQIARIPIMATDGETIPCTEGVVTAGQAVLDATHKVTLTWHAWPEVHDGGYRIWRTQPVGLAGLIGTVNRYTGTFVDTGQAVVAGQTLPTANTCQSTAHLNHWPGISSGVACEILGIDASAHGNKVAPGNRIATGGQTRLSGEKRALREMWQAEWMALEPASEQIAFVPVEPAPSPFGGPIFWQDDSELIRREW